MLASSSEKSSAKKRRYLGGNRGRVGCVQETSYSKWRQSSAISSTYTSAPCNDDGGMQRLGILGAATSDIAA
eukprot:scaffold39283_cov40-Tisochrysis_lutea.AAC.2